MFEVIVVPVDDGSVGEDRSKTAAARLEDSLLAAHIDEAVMLAREARIWQVFSGRRTAYRDGWVSSVFQFEPTVGFENLVADVIRAGSPIDDLARRGSSLGQITHSGGAKVFE